MCIKIMIDEVLKQVINFFYFFLFTEFTQDCNDAAMERKLNLKDKALTMVKVSNIIYDIFIVY